MFKCLNERGFTLIELLLSLTMILLLLTIVSVYLGPAREKARDVSRKNDIEGIEKALFLYWHENGQFPEEDCFEGGVDNCGGADCSINCDSSTNWCNCSDKGLWAELVNSEIIGVLPKDPVNNANYYYWYEPCCNEVCEGGSNCIGKGCCEYKIGAKELEQTGEEYVKFGRWE